MIELVLTICLVAFPDECREERIARYASTADCFGGARESVGAYLSANPKVHVRRINCRPISHDVRLEGGTIVFGGQDT